MSIICWLWTLLGHSHLAVSAPLWFRSYI
uniref:Uncharacterized protein n=1 Tax=Rhizophora mucronata TaxID=61149 RepID=A0A2P2MBM8_RHIMU